MKAPGGPPAGPDGWQRNVWALALSVFIAFVGFQFFAPFLPLYVRELGVTDPAGIALWSGVVTATTPAVAALLAPLLGSIGGLGPWRALRRPAGPPGPHRGRSSPDRNP